MEWINRINVCENLIEWGIDKTLTGNYLLSRWKVQKFLLVSIKYNGLNNELVNIRLP